MARFNLTVTGMASAARGWADHLGGIMPNAGSVGVPVRDACLNLAAACDGVEGAKAKAVPTLTDQSYIAQFRYDQAHVLVDAAYAAAMQATEALKAAIDKGRQAATKALIGANVPPADSPMAAFQAEQITKALEAVPAGGIARINLAVKYLSDALARGDNVTVDVILNRLGVVYDRLGINTALISAQLGQAMQKSPTPGDTSGNGELLAVLSAGGSGTLSGLVDASRYVLTTSQQVYNQWLVGMLRDGQLRGINEASPSPGLQVNIAPSPRGS